MGFTQANPNHKQGVLEKIISLKIESEKIKKVLKKIEKQTNTKFVYSSNAIKADQLISIDVANERLGTVLHTILFPLHVSYEVFDGRILLKSTVDGRMNSLEALPATEKKMVFTEAEQIVSGKVTDASGEGLAGVTVSVKGSTRGTTTDATGAYSINVPDANAVLVFSYTGFESKEVLVGNQTQVNVLLGEGTNVLSEAVVIGYGERSRRDITGSVSSIGTKEIEKSTSQAPEMAMQGRIPGVLVSTPGGAPGTRPTVRIRGVSTLGNNEPLYVVDGIPITEWQNGNEGGREGDLRGGINILTLINPNDIESISVLKDASAAAIYGVRASNGVILINTKKGKAGAPKIDINSSFGVQNITQRYEMLTSSELVSFLEESYANNTGAVIKPELKAAMDKFRNASNYDWQEENIQKNAVNSDLSMRIYGGTNTTNYSLSGGYSFTESPLKGANLERYTMSAVLNSKLNSWLETGVNFRLGYVQARDETNLGGGNFDMRQTASVSPWQPIYDPANPYGFAPTADVTFKANANYDPSKADPGAPQEIDKVNLLWGPESSTNGFAFRSATDDQYRILRNMGTAFLQIQPLKGLKFKGTLSADYSNSLRYGHTFAWGNTYYSETPGNPFALGDGTSKGSYGERNVNNFNLVKEFSISYDRSFGSHHLGLLTNAMDQRYSGYGSLGGNNQNPAANPIYWGLSGVDRFNSSGSFREDNALQGYMGRMSYNYAGRYYLDATLRRDGSSRFAPEYRWGTFPSVAAAWRISSERFMEKIGAINDLKLRAGWGKLGNQETRSYAFLSRSSNTPDYSFGSGAGNGFGVLVGGLNFPDFATRDLTWEVSTTSNLGLDFLALNQRLSGTIEYYNRLTTGILQVAAFPASVGNQNDPVINIASVRNSGMEFTLGWNNRVGNLTYGVSGNLTTVKNVVEKTFRDQPSGGEGGRIEVGQSINYLWGYQTNGIFASKAELDTWKAQNDDKLVNNANGVSAGDIRFVDVNSPGAEAGDPVITAPDGKIDPNDRTYLGKTVPGYFYGFNFDFGYKGIDLSVFFQGVGDVQAVNTARYGFESMAATGLNMSSTIKDRWTAQNTGATIPRAVADDPNNSLRFSDRFIEDAGFLRLKNIQLGYSLPKAMLNRMKMQKLRLYVSSTNTLLFTKWTGLDPEERSSRDSSFIPPARQFAIGINAGF